MSNIQLYNQENALANIPTRDKDIAVALTSQKLTEIPEAQLYEIVKRAISKCYAMARFTAPDGVELQLITDETMKLMKFKYGSLRYQEIDIAFTRGLVKEYGDYKGLSVPTFIDFVKGYLKEETRIKLTTPVEVKTEPTPEQKFFTAASNALKAFYDYNEGKDISLVAPATYRFLYRLKCVDYSEQEQAEFINEATTLVENDLIRQKTSTLDKYKRLEIARTLEDGQKLEQKIILEAQRLGLYAYFQTVMIEEIDLKALLESKKEYFLSKAK